MNTSFRAEQEYTRRYQAGRQMTKTSVARDLIIAGRDNEFIRQVILVVFGEYWENRSINRVRNYLQKSP